MLKRTPVRIVVRRSLTRLNKSSIQSSEQKQQAVDLGMISDEEREHLKLMISQYRRTEFKEALNQLSEKDAPTDPFVSPCADKPSPPARNRSATSALTTATWSPPNGISCPAARWVSARTWGSDDTALA